MPNISDAYLTVLPRLAAGSESIINRNAKALGTSAGKAASDAFNRAVAADPQVASGKAGQKAGQNFGTGFTKDSQDNLKRNKSKFTKAGQEVGTQVGTGIQDGVRRKNKSMADTAEDSGKKSGKAFGGGLVGSIGPIVKGLVATYLGAKLVQGLGDSIRAASDLQETMSKTKNVFKDSTKVIVDWSKSSTTSLGLSQNAALAAASQFGDMFTQLGIGTDKAAGLSQEVVKLAADLGSFHNLDTAEVLDLISSAMRGEFDSIQKILPAISDQRVKTEALNMTHKKTEKQLTASDKAMAALKIITNDSANATNDFAETSDGLANQQKILAGKIEDTKAKIGTALLPVMTGIVKFMNDKAIPAFDKFINGFMGKSSREDMDMFAQKGEDIGLMASQSADEFEGWYTAGQDVKDALEDISAGLKKIADTYKENETTFNAIGVFIGSLLIAKKVGPALMGVAAGIRAIATAGAIGVGGGIGVLVAGVATLVGGVGLFTAALIANEDTVDSWKEKIKNTEWMPQWVKNIYFGLFNAGQGVKNFFQYLGDVFDNWGENIRAHWNRMYSNITGVWNNTINWIKDFVKPFFEYEMPDIIGWTVTRIREHWNRMYSNVESTWNNVKNFITGIVFAISDTLAVIFTAIFNFVVAQARRFVQGIVTGFNNLKTNAITAFNALKNGIGAGWDWIKKHVFNPIVDFVTKTIPSKFTSMKNKILDIWDGLRLGLGRFWDRIMSGAKNTINDIGGFINKMIDAINKIPAVNIPRLPNQIISTKAAASAGGKAMAQGGSVYGGPPGTDTVPAWGPRGEAYRLDNGEHIWTKKEVKAAGGQDAMYAMRRAVLKGAPGFANGGVPGAGNYRPGMGRNVGMVDSLIKLYKKFGGTGDMTSGYRQGDPLWHGSGLAADFGGYNQDKVASRLMENRGGLLELIHSTNKRNYNVTQGRAVNMDSQTNREHKNHVHMASTPEALSMMLGGQFIPGGGQSGTLFDWLSTAAGKAAKAAMSLAKKGLNAVLPKGKDIVSSALRGVAGGIPDKLEKLFNSKAGNASINPGVGGSNAVMASALKTAKGMGASNKVLLALFEAGFVESNFRNLTTAVDHDSLGFLQQRPSMGWPNPTDVPTATRSFVRRAMGKENRYRTAGQLAQAVQVSAYPSRYDAARGRAVSALKGLWPSYVAGNYARGGAVFDQGGWLEPGYSAINKGSRPEAVLTPEESAGLKNMGAGELTDKLDRLIEAVERVAPGVGAELKGAGRSALLQGRRS